MLRLHPDLTDESHQALDPGANLRLGRTPWSQPFNRVVIDSDSVSSDDDDAVSYDATGAGAGAGAGAGSDRSKMPMLYYDSKHFSKTEFWKTTYGDNFFRDVNPGTGLKIKISKFLHACEQHDQSIFTTCLYDKSCLG